jgi:hypothetical protein
MGSGVVSLIAVGAQDVYLTGNPQITHFKVIYRRYTNFALEAIEQSIDSARPGNKFSLQVQRNGDLATKCALKLTTPEITTDNLGSDTEKIAWVRRVGHALIHDVEVRIGGMEIDSQTGTWLDMWWELTHTESSERGYREMIGDVDELTTLTGRQELEGNGAEVLLPSRTLYIPFQFWFCRNYGMALPLIALQYHEVRFEVELERADKLFVWTGKSAPSVGGLQFRDASILIDYVYLEAGERRKYAQLGHEYLIEQIQDSEETLNINANSNSSKEKYKLNFNHPTKELIWGVKVGAFSGAGKRGGSRDGRGKFLTYTHDDDLWLTDALDYAAKNLVESTVFVNPGTCEPRVSINGQCAHLVSNLNNPGYNVGQRVTVELCNTNNECLSEDGSNVDEVNEENIVVYAYDTYKSGNDFFLFGNNNGVELSHFIDSAHVIVSHSSGAPDSIQIEAVEVRHALSLTDVSIPIEDFTTDNRAADSAQYKVHQDVCVTQFSNYGLRLDGRGNPTISAVLELNGHCRFEEETGAYFNYYQTQNHHTRTPADGINVYSFALCPEKHQPSGTTNLSRIDNTELQVTFGDSLRQNNRLRLDIGRDTVLYIFAVNYNVLRVLSGMAGLSYAN